MRGACAPAAVALSLLLALDACLAATPEPAPEVVIYSPSGGEIAGAVIWAIFIVCLLVAGAIWWHGEEMMSVSEQLKILEEKEGKTNERRRRSISQGQDPDGPEATRSTAILPAEETQGEEDWMNVVRYDLEDPMQTQKYKNWKQYLSADHIKLELQAPDTTEAHIKEKFEALMTKEEHIEFEKWQLCEIRDDETAWADMSGLEKIEYVLVIFFKFCGIFCVLYLFIVALGLMGNAFKILGGRQSGKTFRETELFDNPIAGLVLGLLVTVLLQSSSTTTSIIISMSAGGLIEVRNAAFMIMGANIGTSVTNTIVSVFHINNPEEYRRAFTGATYHDMFNWCTVTVFLPLEACTGFLVNIAGRAVESLDIASKEKSGKVDLLKVITKPASGRIISVDKKLIEKIAGAADEAEVKKLEAGTIIKQKSGHVWRDAPVKDEDIGGVMLFVSLLMLCVMLLLLVTLLQSVLRGKVAIWLRWMLNLEFDNVVCRQLGGLDNYILLIFATGVTIIFQSSSVFTSAITPLVGIGLIHVDKLTALTMGANIGTTVTGCLSALAGSNMVVGMQVALIHVFFNCFGTFLWFSVWPLRPIPLAMAKFMGETAYQLNWFPAAYIIGCFFVSPLVILAICLGGWEVCAGVLTPFFFLVVSICLVIYFRRNKNLACHGMLPDCLKSDTCCGAQLPNWLRIERDEAQDQVEFAELRENEMLDREIKRRTKWDYSALCWGLTILSFGALILALPSSQWRRVRYGVDPERHEFGIGYNTVCNADFGSDVDWASAPTATCTPAQMKLWLEADNATLLSDCSAGGDFASVRNFYPKKYAKEADKYWKKKSWKKSKKSGDAKPYHEAWYIASGEGCLADEWKAGCLALAPTPCSGAAHAQWCDVANEAWVNRDLKRGMLDYSRATNPGGKAWINMSGEERRDGEYCKKISDWCPGPLEDDMAAVGGLAITGTLFLGIGTLLLCLFCKTVPADEGCTSGWWKVFRKFILGSAGFLTLSWVMLVAAWGHLLTMEKKSYSCPMIEDGGRGAVMVTGKLKDFTHQSYAWALTIFAWSLISITLPFVWAQAYKELSDPFVMPSLGELQAAQSAADDDMKEEPNNMDTKDVVTAQDPESSTKP